jgi:hypothetical protein
MLPDRATERVVVYVVDTIDLERMEYEDSIDPRLTYAAVVDAKAVDKRDTLKNDLLRQGLLIPGSVLLQNPYRPQQYASISEAAEKFALDKYFIFSLLCQQLGALTVQIQAVEETRGKKSQRMEIKGGNRLTGAKGHGKAHSATVESILSQQELSDTFAGGEPNIEAAEELLRRHRLDDDPVLRSLVDSRAHLANPHKKRHITLDLSRETERLLDLAASVTTPAYFKLEANASSVKSSSVRLRLDYDVTFP